MALLVQGQHAKGQTPDLSSECMLIQLLFSDRIINIETSASAVMQAGTSMGINRVKACLTSECLLSGAVQPPSSNPIRARALSQPTPFSAHARDPFPLTYGQHTAGAI